MKREKFLENLSDNEFRKEYDASQFLSDKLDWGRVKMGQQHICCCNYVVFAVRGSDLTRGIVSERYDRRVVALGCNCNMLLAACFLILHRL